MLGYETLYIIQNFGTLWVTGLAVPVGWALAPLIICICKGEFARLKSFLNRLMFFNYWIGSINETYFFLAICACLNLFFFKWGNYGDVFNSSLAVFFVLVLTAFPIFVAIFYTRIQNYDRILNND